MGEPRISNESSLLSERETEILRLVATGATNQQIALQLSISLNTVKVHLRNIFAKIGVASRTEASLYAVRAGLVAIGRAPGSETVVVETPPTPNAASPRPVAMEELLVEPLPSPPLPPIERAERAPIEVIQAKLPQQRSQFPRWAAVLGLVLIAVILAALGLSRLFRTSLMGSTTPTAVAINTNQWHRRSSMGIARGGFAIAAYESKIYLLGGKTSSGISGAVERYTPQGDSWAQLSSKPTPATDIQAVVIGGKIYVAGGQLSNDSISRQLEIYDPQQDRWSVLPELPEPRSRYAATTIDGKLYLFGGWDGTSYRSEVWMFDPDKQRWEQRASMPSELGNMGLAIVEGRVHLLGGNDGSGPTKLHRVYTPSNDRAEQQPWQVLAPLPEAAEGLGTTTVANIIYVFDPATGKGWSYIPQTDSWQPLGTELPEKNQTLRAVLVNTNVHLFGVPSDRPDSSFQTEFEALYFRPLPLVPRSNETP